MRARVWRRWCWRCRSQGSEGSRQLLAVVGAGLGSLWRSVRITPPEGLAVAAGEGGRRKSGRNLTAALPFHEAQPLRFCIS